MTLAFTGDSIRCYVFVIAVLMGLVRPSDLGVRGALVATIMPQDRCRRHRRLAHHDGYRAHRRRACRRRPVRGARHGAGLRAIAASIFAATLLTLCVVAPSKAAPLDASGRRRAATIADTRPQGRRRLSGPARECRR